MADDVVQKVLSNTYIKADFYKRMAFLREFLEHLIYRGDSEHASSESRTKQLLLYAQRSGNEDVAPAVEAWGDGVLDVFTAEHMYDQLDELTRMIEEMPELVLYIPVALTDAHTASIGMWCRKNIDDHIVLQLEIDPTVIGGCAIAWKNARYDFSLRHFLRKHREELMNTLQVYGNTK